MQMQTRTTLILLICLAVLLIDGRSSTSFSAQTSDSELNRIRFDVATFEESNGRRELLSESTIEGPQGTDFDVKLHGERFQMDAHFLNDLIGSDALKVKADLNTRRAYGKSERGLPLYEEDVQKQSLQLGFDEKLVLLPFGRNDNADQLKIEITPSFVELNSGNASGDANRLEIKILKLSPGNLITVEAVKVPHRFTLTAALLEDGREVAQGQATEASIEEQQRIVLKPNIQASPDVLNNRLAIDIAVNHYFKRCPVDGASVEFGISRLDSRPGGQAEPVLSNWAGVGKLNSTMSYDLTDYYLKSSGRKYELKLGVRLAPGEDSN